MPRSLRAAVRQLDDVERERVTRSLAAAADRAGDRRQFRVAMVYRLLLGWVAASVESESRPMPRPVEADEW